MVNQILSLKQFAGQIFNICSSDRDTNVGVGGFTGEGKSAFSSLLLKEYAKISGVRWGFDLMTWSRAELMKWIDGEPKSEKNELGLRKGQLPEFSGILADELFTMFYRRQWFNEEQIDAIATFNMCRDRHLLLCGNIPNFWELDAGFTNRIRFYVYIVKRGVAWVFQQENNPFSEDNWNKRENKKVFRKHKNPYKIHNFLFEVHFPDWSPEEKLGYYDIRNAKRVTALDDSKDKPKKERYTKVKKQRDDMVNMLFDTEVKCPKCNIIHKNKLTNVEVAEVLGVSAEAVRLVREG